MKYYMIKENKSILYRQKVDIMNKYYTHENVIVSFFETDKIYYREYVDFLLTPFLTFSNKFKLIIDYYCENIYWEPLLMVEPKNNTQELYWIIAKPKCSSYLKTIDKTLYISDEIPFILENAFLTFYDTEKTYGNNIQYRGFVNSHKIILREDIVEHFLDENIYGAIFEPVCSQ